jgi:Ca2+-binding EF-hand superfamily protein
MQKSVLPVLLVLGAMSFAMLVNAEGFTPWPDVLKMADKDGDGKVSPSEVMFFDSDEHFVGFQPFMADHFKDFDSDGDGFVSLDECRSGIEKLGMSDDQITKAFFERQGFMPNKGK